VQEEGRRRLAVRAGDAGDLELARRLAEERVGRDGHRRAARRHDELRHVDARAARSTTSATRRRDRVDAKSCRRARPGTQKNARPA
jgi:hypothetical protein